MGSLRRRPSATWGGWRSIGWLLAGLVVSSALFATAAQANFSVGDTVTGSWHPLGSEHAVALPEGRWTIDGLIEQASGQGGHFVTAVLTSVQNGILKGLIWVRAADGAQRSGDDRLFRWCNEEDLARRLQTLETKGPCHGCRWVRGRSTQASDPSLSSFWQQAFHRLRDRSVQIPLGTIVAGYHLSDPDAFVTVEYSFDSKNSDFAEVFSWSESWTEFVTSAFYGQGLPHKADKPPIPTHSN